MFVPLDYVTEFVFPWAFGVNPPRYFCFPTEKKSNFRGLFRFTILVDPKKPAFFGGYFLAALPGWWLLEKNRYQTGEFWLV